jgi:hypothetical protein
MAVANLTSQKHFLVLISVKSLSKLQGYSTASIIKHTDKKINDLIRNLTHNLPPCSIVPQRTTLPHKIKNEEQQLTVSELA